MKIILQAKNIDLTPSIKEFVDEKVGMISKLLNDKDEELAEARVEVGKPSRHHQSGFVFYAEINLKIGKQLLRATEEHLDLHTAIDAARDKIEMQLRKVKEIKISGRRN
ncbi:MAG: ribosome-associated translation inhibitor RaiA [bacterium]|nr:ribosome-associated translation inhibitor RaiA [bacterium]